MLMFLSMKLKSHVLPDASFKDLLRIDDIFADIINVTLFCGHQVINPNCLSYFDTELSQNIQYNDDVLSVIRRSDLMKRYSSSHMNILFGIEIQSVPDKNMPIRIAGYTYLSYVILDKNKEKKIPVIMIVLYVGEREWKEGRRLSESLEVPKSLEDVFNDFQAPIYDIREIESERCQSEELRDLVDLLQKIYERDFHFEERGYNKQACIVAFSITGDKELLEIANRKEGKIKMCEAIRELRYEAMMKGEIKGREEGEAKKQIEIAIEMKKDERFSNEDIQKFTGLSIEQLALL